MKKRYIVIDLGNRAVSWVCDTQEEVIRSTGFEDEGYTWEEALNEIRELDVYEVIEITSNCDININYIVNVDSL